MRSVFRFLVFIATWTALLTSCGGGGSSSNGSVVVTPVGGGSPSGTGITSLALFAGNMGGLGNLNGVGPDAYFNGPNSVAVDNVGNVYVADTGNQTVRKITPAGMVTTLAGTPGTTGHADGIGAAASFNIPNSIAVDGAGNVYVADMRNQVIRKITPAGVVTTLAGPAGVFSFGFSQGLGNVAPFYVAADNAGNVYVADFGEATVGSNLNAVSRITPDGVISNLATTSRVFFSGVAVDNASNVYVSDRVNNTIGKITAAGAVTVIAGTAGVTGSADGIGAAASFDNPASISVDSTGNLYVADSHNNTIRKITPSGTVTTLAGSGLAGNVDGAGASTSFNQPLGVAVNGVGNVYVADTSNNAIRKITPAAVVSTLSGSAGVAGSADGVGAAALFNNPWGVATDGAGNVYVADASNNVIRKITPAGVVTTLAGSAGIAGTADGTGNAALFSTPVGVAADGAGNLYVSDNGNSTIRKISQNGVVTTLAGAAQSYGHRDGIGAAAMFDFPLGVATDNFGNVYVADGDFTIRKITPDGIVTTLAGASGAYGSVDGTGAAARFELPISVAADGVGNIYVADFGGNTIRKITSSGVVSTLAGTAGTTGSVDGTGTKASFNQPSAVAADSAGNVYVSDSANDIVRKITAAGVVTTVVGSPGRAGFSAGTLPASIGNARGLAISGTTLYIAAYNGVAVVKNLP